MYKKAVLVITMLSLFSVIALGIVSATPSSPDNTSSVTPSATPQSQDNDSFEFLIAALSDARESDALPDPMSDALTDWLIENLIAPETGETPEEIETRLSEEESFDLLMAALNEARDKGALTDGVSDLLADLFIEHLIASVAGETEQRPESESAPDSVTIDLPAGWSGYLTHPTGAKIEVAEGTTDHAGMMKIEEVANPEYMAQDVAGKVYDFSVGDESLDRPVTLHIPYELEEGQDSENLVVVHWNEETQEWERVAGVIDLETQTIEVTTSELSLFRTIYDFFNPPKLCDNFSSNEECLAHRFAPVLKMHPDERFLPRPVEGFVGQATLKDGAGNVIATNPSPGSLGNAQYDDSHYLDVPDLDDDTQDSQQYPPTVYWRVTVNGLTPFMQYYLFYNYDYLNPRQRIACAKLANPEQHDTGPIPDGLARFLNEEFCHHHEADWELIQLEFNSPIIKQGHTPENVEYSQHSWSEGRDWSYLEEHDDLHPVAYVALGKHANYFGYEEDSEYVSTVRDQISARGKILYPPALSSNSYKLEKISDNIPWVAYKGKWGGSKKKVDGPDNYLRWELPWLWAALLNFVLDIPVLFDPINNGEADPDPEPTPVPPSGIVRPPSSEVSAEVVVPVYGVIEAREGDSTYIPVEVTNTGDIAWTFHVTASPTRGSGPRHFLRRLGEESVSLEPYESRILNFPLGDIPTGMYGLRVGVFKYYRSTPLNEAQYDDIIRVVRESDLELTLSAPSTVDAGDSLTYTVSAYNHGPNKARGVWVRSDLTGGATFSSASGNGKCSGGSTIMCYFANVKVGRADIADVTVNVPRGASGSIVNDATVYIHPNLKDIVDPYSANDRASVTTVVYSESESPTPTPTPTPTPDVPTGPLVADAGPDKIVRPGDLVVLDGGGSSDGIHNWWYAGSAMSLPAGCDHCGDYVFDTIPLDIWNSALRFTAPELEYGINSITLKYQLDVHVGDEVVSDEAVVCVVEDASLVDRTNAGLWSDCQSARRATPTPTPTSAPAPAPRPKPVVCLRSLGTITASVVVKGKWNSDCVSSRRPGSYYRAYTFSLANSSVISVDTYSNRELGYIELMTHDYQHIGSGNGVGGDTLSAGSYFVEAATHNQGQDAADFALSISILNPDSPPGPLTADAGPDRIVRPGDTVSLDGSGSTSGAFYDWNRSASAVGVGSGCTNDDCDNYVYDEISPGSPEMNVTFTAPELKNGVELITLQYRLEVWYGSNSEFDDMVVCIVEDPSKVPTTGDLWSDCQNYDNP